MIVLQTRGLKKVYGTGEARVRALDGVDLDVEQGEFVAVVGTSGSGKSTLLHMLGGLDRPTAGTVTVDGRNIFALSDEALTVFRRRKIGFVFQAYNLVPVLSVWENIVLPVQLDGRRPDKAYLSQVVEALGGPAGHPAGGRAHRQPGLQDQPGRAEPDEGDGAALCPDDGDDHPQRGNCPAGGPHRAHRGRAHRDEGVRA